MRQQQLSPECTFKKDCAFKSYRKCQILTDMPKERDGDCPFRKHPSYKNQWKKDRISEEYGY